MKVGLYFGTFNPIHIGHLVIAVHMAEFTDLDKVWFVVTPHNPHKKKNTLLDDYNRLELVHRAVKDYPQLYVSAIEFDLPQPSYTSTTLSHIKEKYPEHEFALIMGQDNLNTFHKWRNYENILENHQIYVYPRLNTEEGPLKEHPSVNMTDAPIMQLSSSFIRSAIKQNKDIRAMLPHHTWDYIDEMSFYRK